MRALLTALVLLAACDAYDRDIGPTPFFCGPDEPSCPMGYSCVDDPANGTKVCVSDDDSISGNFDCDDDSDTEPNDTLAMAATTPLDGSKSYSLDGRAICPAGDKDTYAIMIATDGESVEAAIDFQANGSVLQGAILNTGGVPIATATVSGDATMVKANARNLTAGLYYVQVTSAQSGTAVNNYKLSLAVTGP